jgi:hypothetical protein
MAMARHRKVKGIARLFLFLFREYRKRIKKDKPKQSSKMEITLIKPLPSFCDSDHLRQNSEQHWNDMLFIT